ncbi:MAG: DUF222 domain-containing protein, partial [Actinomycetota bacterium]
SSLRSVLEEYRSEDLAEQPNARLEDDFLELHGGSEIMDLERLRRLAAIDRRRTYERNGSLSTTAWLISELKMAPGIARQQVRMARALEEMPETVAALEAGEVSMSAARALVAARETDTEAFARGERELVDAARLQSIRNLEKVCAYWRQAVEREHALEGEERLKEHRKLHASVTFFGMVRLDGDLDPEAGELLLTAIDAVIDTWARSGLADERTPAQRRHDALVEIIRQWLASRDRHEVGGELPHVTVLVDAETLRDDAGDTCEMEHVGPVAPETIRKIACDASVRRVVMKGRSEPLDVGRRTPVWPPAIRAAVIARDKHCRFPGCDRPPSWCQVHHVQHWTAGGATSKANGLLLCTRHHDLVHPPGRFRLAIVDERPVFRRPDGSVLEDRGPPDALAS